MNRRRCSDTTVVIFAGVLVGCAHEMGKQATEGAIETVKKDAEKSGSAGTSAEPAVAKATGSVVQGSLEQLNDPEQLAMMRRIVAATVGEAVDTAYARFTGPAAHAGATAGGGGTPLEVMSGQAAHAFAAGLSTELASNLGSEGGSPVGPRMSAAIAAMAASASRGVAATLSDGFGDCQGLSAERCADLRLQRVSQSAAVGFARGLRQAIGWWALVAAFAGGMVVMAALVMAARLLSTAPLRRGPHRSHVPAPA